MVFARVRVLGEVAFFQTFDGFPKIGMGALRPSGAVFGEINDLAPMVLEDWEDLAQK
jgi:hypothetical protein